MLLYILAVIALVVSIVFRDVSATVSSKLNAPMLPTVYTSRDGTVFDIFKTYKICYMDNYIEEGKYPRHPLDIVDPSKYGGSGVYETGSGMGVFYIDYLNDIVAMQHVLFQVVTRPEDADLLICEIWGEERRKYRHIPTIQQGYEAKIETEIQSLNGYPNIVYTTSILRPGPYFYLPLGTKYYGFEQYKFPLQIATPTKFCLCIVGNQVDTYRKKFIYELMSRYKHVDCYGSLFKNADSDIINSTIWFDPRIIPVVQQYKFIIVMENQHLDGYHTEKLLHGFRAGVVPIYWGDPNIVKFYNPDSYIYIEPDEDISSAIDKVARVDQDDELYRTMVNAPKMTSFLESTRMTEAQYFGRMLVDLIEHKQWSNQYKEMLPYTVTRPHARVAICISGSKMEYLLRTLQEVVNSIPYSIHVYIYGTVQPEVVGNAFIRYMIENCTTNSRLYVYDASNHEHIKLHPLFDRQSIKPMLFNMQACMKMVTDYERFHNHKYDCVVRMRPDILMNHSFDPLMYTRPNTLSVMPPLTNFFDMDGINDHMFIADSATMSTICQAYNHLSTLFENIPIDRTQPIAVEEFLYVYARKCGIYVLPNMTDISYNILRHIASECLYYGPSPINPSVL